MHRACRCHAHGGDVAATSPHSPPAATTTAVHGFPDGPESSSDPEDSCSESDDDEEQEHGEGHEVDDDEDIARSARWSFLARPFRRWLQSVQYSDHRASTSVDLQFDAFYVFLPNTVASTPSGKVNILQKLRDATELVAYMLQLDKNAWWFARKLRKPWFAAFFPSNYDPEKLVPKMTFVLHQRFGPGDDHPDSVKRLHYMLVDCDHERHDDSGSADASSFFRTKRRILDACDPENRLRDFKIPIAIQLRPEEAHSPDQLKAYLLDVITLVQAVQTKTMRDVSYAFRLDEITLGLHLKHASDAHAELKQLLALGVPVTVRLRHPHTHISLPFAWSDFGWRANVFPAFVGDDVTRPTIHTIVSRAIHSSVELLSAVASSTSLVALEIEPDDEHDEATELDHAKWLAYALRRNRTLRSLEMHNFQGTHAVLDTMAAIQNARDPARLLLPSDTTETNQLPQFVRLRSDALIVTPESSGPQSFAELNISSDAELSVVRIKDNTIAFIVPGHAICSAPLSSIASTRTEDPANHHQEQQQTLASLALTDAYCDRGVVPRLVRLIGQSLQELRWADCLEGGYDEDLDAVATACPQLTRLYLQGSSLRSLTSRWLPQLRTLSLTHTAVSNESLVALFQSLTGDTTLENLSYYCPGHSLDASAADAALQMLATNRHLQSLSVGIASAIYDQYEPQFQDARDVAIQVERLSMAQKWALCSVVQHHQAPQTTTHRAVGRLDRACLTQLFQCFARHAYRRVRVIQSA